MTVGCAVQALPVGDQVRIVVSMTNEGDDPIDPPVGGWEIAVSVRQPGATGWESLATVSPNESLLPGESRRVECWWQHPMPGMASVEGRISLSDDLLTDQTYVSVPSPPKEPQRHPRR